MRGLIVIACLLALMVVSAARAQEFVETQELPGIEVLAEEVARDRAQSAGNESALVPQAVCSDIADEVTQADCWQAFRDYFAYYASGFEHRKKVFAWHHLSTRIIFIVVNLLVAVGIYFAWIQFRHDLVASGRRDATESEPRGHEIEVGTHGVKVSSPILGVIILAISLAFFYLYLVHVYPIREIL